MHRERFRFSWLAPVSTKTSGRGSTGEPTVGGVTARRGCGRHGHRMGGRPVGRGTRGWGAAAADAAWRHVLAGVCAAAVVLLTAGILVLARRLSAERAHRTREAGRGRRAGRRGGAPGRGTRSGHRRAAPHRTAARRRAGAVGTAGEDGRGVRAGAGLGRRRTRLGRGPAPRARPARLGADRLRIRRPHHARDGDRAAAGPGRGRTRHRGPSPDGERDEGRPRRVADDSQGADPPGDVRDLAHPPRAPAGLALRLRTGRPVPDRGVRADRGARRPEPVRGGPGRGGPDALHSRTAGERHGVLPLQLPRGRQCAGGGRKDAVVEIDDAGLGMPPDVLDQALGALPATTWT